MLLALRIQRDTHQIVMKLENLRAEIKRWGWMRVLFKHLMCYLRKYAGLHIYRVNKRPLGRHPGTPDLPNGITLAIAPPEKLVAAAADPELHMEPSFVRAAYLHRSTARGGSMGQGRSPLPLRVQRVYPAALSGQAYSRRPFASMRQIFYGAGLYHRSRVQRDFQLSQHCRRRVFGKA